MVISRSDSRKGTRFGYQQERLDLVSSHVWIYFPPKYFRVADLFWRLCSQVTALIAYCTKTVSKIVTAKEDAEDDRGPPEKVRSRRKRAPYQFDELVENAAARLGKKINARSFRDSRLSEWRKFLASLPDDADCVLEMERRIDGEVAYDFRVTLSIPLRELSQVSRHRIGKSLSKLKVAVEQIRQLEAKGVRGKGELLVST